MSGLEKLVQDIDAATARREAEKGLNPPVWQDYPKRSLLIAWDGEILEQVVGGEFWWNGNKQYIDRESAKAAVERRRK